VSGREGAAAAVPGGATAEAPPRLPRAAGFAAGARALAPLLVSLSVGAVVLGLTGRNPATVYWLYLAQAAGSWQGAANTVAAATPLALTGIGTAIAFRAGFFNVGLEGAVYTGALATAFVGATGTWLPGPLLPALALVAGLVVGAAWLVPPALLRAFLAIDEVVTTLMLNYVGIALTTYVVLYHFLYKTIGNAQSPPVAASAALAPLVAGADLTVAAPLALGLLLLYGWFLRRTRLGTEARMVGDSPRFAAAMGFSTHRAALLTMIVGGALGGLAGGAVVLGVTGNFTAGFSTAPGYGYTGIAVAVLGRGSWVGLGLSALFFGALASAGGTIQLFGNVPIALTEVLQGTLMIFAGVRLVHVRLRWRRS
jgi:ABC-type uncharacterized transport system permease subunit